MKPPWGSGRAACEITACPENVLARGGLRMLGAMPVAVQQWVQGWPLHTSAACAPGGWSLPPGSSVQRMGWG